MNKATARLTTAFFSIVLLTLTGAALAQEPGHYRDGPHHGRDMLPMPGVDKMMRAVRHLDLSDAQRDTIRDIMHSLKTEDRQMMREMRTGREQLRDLIKADTFDESAVADIAGKEGALTTERLMLASRAMSKVYAQLTDEQREELAAMAAEREARRADKRERWSDDD